MHWLPLVAMVIASALPFPHDPASRIVAATTTSTAPGNDNINNNIIDNNNNLHQSASASLPLHHHHASSSSDYNSHDPTDYKSMQTDYNMADREPQNQKDFITSSSNEVDDRGVYELNLASSLEVPPTEGAPTWTRDVLEGQKDTKTYQNSLDFNTKNDIQDSVSTVSPASQMQSPDLTKERTTETQAGFVEENSGLNFGLDGLLEGGDMFLDAHPRVLFSRSASPPEDPPLQLMLESGLLEEEEEDHKEWDTRTEGHGDRASRNENAGHKRDKRSHSFDGRWVQRSVCESENVWVINKTAAFDSSGKMVSILPEIQTQTGPIKQYFYETRCRRAENPPGGRHEETGVAGASCLGIDKKQWKSKCIAKQSYVRALTKDTNNRVGWRWIRIDSSCVCVLLSRTNKAQAREVLTGRG